MPLPRKAEFDAQLFNGGHLTCGAPFWAYGSNDGTTPFYNGWNGWTSWTNTDANLGALVEYTFYYDAGRVFFSIADYTNDSQWTAIAHRALEQGYYPWCERPWSDNTAFYLTAPNAPRINVKAHTMFPWGAFLDWQRNPDAAARARALRIVHALGNCGNFGHFTPVDFYRGSPINGSPRSPLMPQITREIGYNLLCKCIAKRAGFLDVYTDPWNGWFGKPAGYFYPLWGLRAGDFEYDGQGAPPGTCTTTTMQGLALELMRQFGILLTGGTPTLTDLSLGGTASGVIAPEYCYARPFMICNLIEGLAEFDAEFGDARILPAVLDVLEKMWTACFLPSGITMQNVTVDGSPAPVLNYVIGINAMRYTDRMNAGNNSAWGEQGGDPTAWVPDGNGGWKPYASGYRPCPELNGLIIPSYFWAYQKTGNTMWRDRCDLLFDGLVRILPAGAIRNDPVSQMYWNNGKTFNQIMSRTSDYIMDAIGAVVPPPVDPPPPSSVPTIAVDYRLISMLGNQPNAIALIEDAAMRKQDPTVKYGSLDHPLSVAKFDATNHEHSLIRFSGLSVIPVGSVITKVTLGLWGQFNTGTSQYLIDVRRVLRPWVESQVDWNEFATGQTWGTAGCLSDGVDRVAAATVQINAPGGSDAWVLTTQTTTGGMITDVQAWVNGTVVNNGWHFERNGAGADGQWRAFANSQNPDHTINPYLLVYFSAASVMRPEETASLLARGASTMIALDAGSAL